VLLAREPHLVLDGAVLAAGLTGARQVLVVAHGAVREIVDEAVAERRRARCDPVPVRVLTGAGRFVAGEATALVNWVEHGIPLPTRVPPRISEHGLGGRPTLVQNVDGAFPSSATRTSRLACRQRPARRYGCARCSRCGWTGWIGWIGPHGVSHRGQQPGLSRTCHCDRPGQAALLPRWGW
jgi:hypothetical protein